MNYTIIALSIFTIPFLGIIYQSYYHYLDMQRNFNCIINKENNDWQYNYLSDKGELEILFIFSSIAVLFSFSYFSLDFHIVKSLIISFSFLIFLGIIFFLLKKQYFYKIEKFLQGVCKYNAVETEQLIKEAKQFNRLQKKIAYFCAGENKHYIEKIFLHNKLITTLPNDSLDTAKKISKL